MIRLLDKNRELPLMEVLFDIMRDNMAEVAPSGLACGWEKEKWLEELTHALKKEARQIVLMYCAGALVGFCMYYVNGGVFMIEELQIMRGFRSSGLIAELWKFFDRTIPGDTVYMEAYTDAENIYSQKLLDKLGLKNIDNTPDGQLHHFRGEFNKIRIR